MDNGKQASGGHSVSENNGTQDTFSNRESNPRSAGAGYIEISATPYLNDNVPSGTPTTSLTVDPSLIEAGAGGFPSDLNFGPLTLPPYFNFNLDTDPTNPSTFLSNNHNPSTSNPDFPSLTLVEPQTATSAGYLFANPQGFPTDTTTIINNFDSFMNNSNNATMSQGGNYPTFNPTLGGLNDARNHASGLNQYQYHNGVNHEGFNFTNPLAAIPSSAHGVSLTPTPSIQSSSFHSNNGAGYNQYQNYATPPNTVSVGANIVGVGVSAPQGISPYHDLLNPAPVSATPVHREYVNLEVNRITQPGPIPHPDKDWRPYGTKNWHFILHDHTLLKHLSNSEIKAIRDHAGALGKEAFESAEQEKRGRSGSASTTSTVKKNGSKPKTLPIGDGTYNTDDTTQVWQYCHAYLSRRGQMRNNNAARRSRMKKESETRYWKLLALAAGVVDHEYQFTEEEEDRAIARWEAEKLEKAAQEEAEGDQPKPKKRSAPSGTGVARGRKAAKKTAAATAVSAGGAQLYAGSAGGMSMSPPPAMGQNMYGGGQEKYYQGYVPAPVAAQQQQQPYYDQYQQSYQGQFDAQPIQHGFNTRARARAEQTLSNLSVTGCEVPAINAATAGSAQSSTMSPDTIPQYDGSPAADTTASQQANSSQEEKKHAWMDVYLNI